MSHSKSTQNLRGVGEQQYLGGRLSQQNAASNLKNVNSQNDILKLPVIEQKYMNQDGAQQRLPIEQQNPYALNRNQYDRSQLDGTYPNQQQQYQQQQQNQYQYEQNALQPAPISLRRREAGSRQGSRLSNRSRAEQTQMLQGQRGALNNSQEAVARGDKPVSRNSLRSLRSLNRSGNANLTPNPYNDRAKLNQGYNSQLRPDVNNVGLEPVQDREQQDRQLFDDPSRSRYLDGQAPYNSLAQGGANRQIPVVTKKSNRLIPVRHPEPEREIGRGLERNPHAGADQDGAAARHAALYDQNGALRQGYNNTRPLYNPAPGASQPLLMEARPVGNTYEFPQRNSYGFNNMSLMRRQLQTMRRPAKRPAMANGVTSFLYMVEHVDDITQKDHPAKHMRENAKQLSMAYYQANSTEKQTAVYQTWKARWLDKYEEPQAAEAKKELPKGPQAIVPAAKPKNVQNEITELLEDEADDD